MTLTFENISFSGHIKFLFFKEKNECSLVKRWPCVWTAGCSHMLIDSYCSAIHSLDTTSAFSTPTYTLAFPLTNPIPRCFLSFLSSHEFDDHDISPSTSINANINLSSGIICAFIKRNKALAISYSNIYHNIQHIYETTCHNKEKTQLFFRNLSKSCLKTKHFIVIYYAKNK